jgi:hypothetical protein
MKGLTWEELDRLTAEDVVRYYDEIDRTIKERKEQRLQNISSIQESDDDFSNF